MPVIHLSTYVNAPIERVFNLSRSISLHTLTMKHTGEKAVAGVKNGLIELNQTVTWQAKHLFKTRFLETKITAMKPYTFFTDEMVKGDFKMMKHDHYFSILEGNTLMQDTFTFETPYGIAGHLVNYLFLKSYLTRLLKTRNSIIKEYAESNKWQEVL